MKLKQLLFTLAVMLSCFVVSVNAQVAEIGNTGYETLTKALAAANAGQTITFVADITEDVTISKAITIDGAGKTYTGKMTLKADVTINNVNFDGKGYNGYAIETRGANYVTINGGTAKNYGYGFVQLASATALTTVKDVTVSNMNYGIKVDYSGAVVLEKADITAGVAAVLNSNYGEKTITIKDSKLNILGTWKRNDNTKTTYLFEGANTIGKFITEAAIDNFKLAAGATLTAPEEITVTTSVEDYEVKYKDGEYYLSAIPYAAKIGDVRYRTLADAVAAVKNGETINLNLDVVTEDVTLTEKTDLYYTIDGNSKTLKGTITVSSLSDTNDNRRITIKNINFVDTEAGRDFITSTATNHYPRLTVEGCSFTGTGKEAANSVAIRLKSSHSVVIKDCKGEGLHSLLQNTSGWNLTIEGVTVTDSKSGLALGTVQGVTVKNSTIETVAYGVRLDANTYNNNAVIEGNKIKAFIPVVVRKANTNSYITINSGNEFTATNTDGLWFAAGTSEYEENGTMPTAATAKVFTLINAENINVKGMYGHTFPAAKIEGVWYATLAEAITAAQAGQTITLIDNIAASEIIIVNKAITIDGNGKTLTSTATRAINVETEGNVVISNLTIKAGERAINIINKPATVELNNVTATANNNAVMIATSAGAAKVTIDNCNFTGLAVVNVAGESSNVAIKNSTITNVDANADENYGAITVWTSAENAVVNVENTTINVADDSKKAYVFPATAIITGVDQVGRIIATVGDAGYETLAEAVKEAKAGETINVVYDITSSEIITVNKALTIEGNGKTLTSTATRAINVETEGKVVISDLTIKAGERAINIINKPATVELNNVTATANNNAVMIATSAGDAKVTINNCNFTGLAVVNVAGEKSNVTIKNSTITNVDANADENYGAITVYTTAENAVVNVENTTINVADDSKKAYVFPATAIITGVDQVGRIIATIGDAGYETLAEAIEDAKAGQTINVVYDITSSEIITVNKALTIEGNGKTLTSKAARAIDVSGADGVTIKNLTVVASGERAFNVIQKATNLTLDNVTATADNYTVNVASSAPNAVVYIKNSTLNGLCTVNVSAEGAEVTVQGSTVNCNDNNTTAGEAYAALSLNKDAVGGSIIATGSTINVVEGSDSYKGRNGAENGTVTINGSTEDVLVVVAVITYPGSSYYHGFATLAAAVEFANDGDVITLIRNTTGAGVVINKSITIDFNGKTYTANEGVGSTGTETLGLQILKGDVTLKNGTLTSEGDKVKMLINNYTNLVVNNMKLVDATDAIQYVLSNNSGNVVIENGSEITADGAIAFDACKYANYEAPVVTVKDGVKVTGDVEVSATLNMNGTLNGTIVIDKTTGVVKGATGYNVTTTVADHKVDYNTETGIYELIAKTYTVQVGEDAKYETLADAITDATAGATITFLADITEDVTLAKNVTIDGAGKTYTGKMTASSNNGTVIVKNVNFDGKGYNGYAIETRGVYYLTVENCTAKNYGYGFVQTASGTVLTTVKNVTISDMNYGVKVDYSSAVSLENVKMINVKSGVLNSNYGEKTITIKNSEITTINIWERNQTIYTTFKFEGLNKVASFTTSQYAKLDAEAKSSDNFYGDLALVVANVAKAATVELCKDVTLKGGNEKDAEAGLIIDKELILEGNAHTIDCGTFVKGIRVYNPIYPEKWRATFQNVTIVNNNANGRCIDTRNGAINLSVLNNSRLIATNGNSQPLTIGGSEPINSVTLSNHVTIDAGKSGYAVINFVPVKQFISTAGACEISGYAAFYCKADGIRFNLTNTKINGKNIHSSETNRFGAIVLEGNNNIINLHSRTDLTAIAEGGAEQAAILVLGNNNTITLEEKYSGKTNISAEVFTKGANAYWAMVNAEATGNSIVKYAENVELAAECDGFQFISFEDAMRYAKNGSTVKLLANVNYTTANYVTDCDGYASIINVEGKTLTLDLNGKTIKVDANADDLTNAKGQMLLAVLSTDEGGHLILTDSSNDKKGTVEVNAINNAKVYSLVTNYEDGCTVTINGGNYNADNVYDALIYSGANEGVTVNDGNFRLDSVGKGDRGNGSPWIFNVLGQNERHTTVYGGTYNADINHQFWANEVFVPENLAVKANGDDTWTIVDAVAYTNEKATSRYSKWRHVGYATIEDAIAAATGGEYNCEDNKVTMVKDLVIEPISIAKNVKVVLNLNGKIIKGTDEGTASFGLINIQPGADLTIEGRGTIRLIATQDRGWNAYSSVISNQRGKLTVNGGTIEHLGGTSMAYAIDNLTNGNGTYAETVINGGTIKSTYRAIRQFLNGTEADNILTVTGGVIEGTNKSIWMQDPSAKANNGTLYVTEDAQLVGNVYLTVTAGSKEWPVEVMIAKAALQGESTVLANNNVPEGYAVSKYPTYWTVEQTKLATLTIEDACESYVNVVEKTVGELTYVRKFTGEWETIYLPFAVPMSVLKDKFDVAYIYNASNHEGRIDVYYVVIKDESMVLAANYPYLIRAKENATTTDIVVNNAQLMPTTAENLNSIDCSSVFEAFNFIGNYGTIEVDDAKGYFELKNGAWTKMDTPNPFRVYMQVTMRNGAPFEYPAEEQQQVRMRRVDENGNIDINELEGIEGTEEKEDMIFDLNGRRITEPVKGLIYIINGQKVLY